MSDPRARLAAAMCAFRGGEPGRVEYEAAVLAVVAGGGDPLVALRDAAAACDRPFVVAAALAETG